MGKSSAICALKLRTKPSRADAAEELVVVVVVVDDVVAFGGTMSLYRAAAISSVRAGTVLMEIAPPYAVWLAGVCITVPHHRLRRRRRRLLVV